MSGTGRGTLIGLVAGLTLLMTGAAFAQARARSLDDCEKISDALAYNQCLASFSPRRGQRASGAYPAARDPEATVPRARRGGAVAPGITMQRSRPGRVRATIDIGPGRAR
jgi:hypothetical protein